MTEAADIFLGRIVKPFGIRGEVKLSPSDDFWEEVLDSGELFVHFPKEGELGEKRITLASSRRHGRSYVLRLKGVEDRSTAESFVGAELFISRDRIDVAWPDKMLPFQIVGCSVRTEGGSFLGEVTAVLFSRAHDVYEISGEDKVYLVPAVPEFVVSIDAARKEMVIRPIPGLLDE